MEYAEWANAYLKQASIIYIQLKQLKQQVEQVSELEQNQLKSRIYILYNMYLECKHIGEFLNKRAKVQAIIEKERGVVRYGETSSAFRYFNREHPWGATVSI